MQLDVCKTKESHKVSTVLFLAVIWFASLLSPLPGWVQMQGIVCIFAGVGKCKELKNNSIIYMENMYGGASELIKLLINYLFILKPCYFQLSLICGAGH